jgi:Na+-driven multidrug efflux pump
MMSFGVIAFGELVVQAAINSCGVVFVTGMAAARRYFSLLNIVGGALEGSVVTFVGQNYGAHKFDRIRQGTRTAVLMGMGASLMTTLVVYFMAEPMIRFFIPEGSPESIRIGMEALRVLALFLVFLYLLCEFRAAIQGMGNAVYPMLSGVSELICRLAAVLLLPKIMGQEGLFFTDSGAWIFTMLLMVYGYRRILRREEKKASE